MRPFVLVQASGGVVDDVACVGLPTETEPFIADFDDLEDDAERSRELAEEIRGKYFPGEVPDGAVKAALDRLDDIVGDVDSEDDLDEEDDESDEEALDVDPRE